MTGYGAGPKPTMSKDSPGQVEFDRLRHQGGAFYSATQLTRTPILVTDATLPGDPIIFANAAFLSFFGYAEDDVIGQDAGFLSADPKSRETIAALQRALAEGREEPLDIALRHKDGTESLTSLMMLSMADKDGIAVHHFMSFLDRSELAAAAANVRALSVENIRLVKALTERDLLVAETNHRVKNTLMQASMLLMMEGRRNQNPDVAEAMSSTRIRLETMAGIYDLLSIKDAKSVDIGVYLEPLVRQLIPPAVPVAVETRIAPGIVINPDIAQPIALIAVELVTNAIKHAFPRRRVGLVRVEFIRTGDGVRLMVADNGVGMPGGVSESLGYKLVRGLEHRAFNLAHIRRA